ncbi:MAG: serine/threonine-protein kinase [Pseudomonadota bacterium]
MLKPGHILDGKYSIESLLGEGGMGAVFVARHTVIGRRVAIKVLHPHFAGDHEVVARFVREAKATVIIAHENIIEVTDVGRTDEGYPYLVMQLLEGETLAQRLDKEGKLSCDEARSICVQILSALGVAHAKGIVHRDLKPENIFLTTISGKRDFVKILDFGISKFIESVQGVQAGMTRTGSILGTPHYMAPEQARGEKVDHRIDIYAVGVMLYQMTTGRLPYDAPNTNALLLKIMIAEAVPPRKICPEIPRDMDAVILKSTARSPDERFFSAPEFLAHLERCSKSAAFPSAGSRPTTADATGGSSGHDAKNMLPAFEHPSHFLPRPPTTLSMSADEKGTTIHAGGRMKATVAALAAVIVMGFAIPVAVLLVLSGKASKPEDLPAVSLKTDVVPVDEDNPAGAAAAASPNETNAGRESIGPLDDPEYLPVTKEKMVAGHGRKKTEKGSENRKQVPGYLIDMDKSGKTTTAVENKDAGLKPVKIQSPGKSVSVPEEGTAKEGFLSVSTIPRAVKILIDQKDTGKNSPIIKHKVAAGSHKITLILETGERHDYEVEIMEGKNNKIIKDFTK